MGNKIGRQTRVPKSLSSFKHLIIIITRLTSLKTVSTFQDVDFDRS